MGQQLRKRKLLPKRRRRREKRVKARKKGQA